MAGKYSAAEKINPSEVCMYLYQTELLLFQNTCDFTFYMLVTSYKTISLKETFLLQPHYISIHLQETKPIYLKGTSYSI